jgi:signal transduction histidine kinase
VDSKCELLHELLNSLTVVLGECELLQDKACQDANQRLTIIREKATHMTEIIRHYECLVPRYEPRREGVIRSIVRAAIGL